MLALERQLEKAQEGLITCACGAQAEYFNKNSLSFFCHVHKKEECEGCWIREDGSCHDCFLKLKPLDGGE